MTLTLEAIKQLAIEKALELGAGSVRISSAQSDPETHDRMRASFARGDLASWGYGDGYAECASNPQSLLDTARAVVSVAVAYASEPLPRGRLDGRVSNYAWSPDYHHRMREMLAQIADVIDAAAGESVCAVACDTAPLAERAYAAKAGLGWVGKHTNLISPELGSFVFLGEIATSLPLPSDDPIRKQCGSCTRCVDACPTRALRGDYTIDASRCISDLTQRTDAIPRSMRALIGEWVWGCDICQDVCPPTKRAGYGTDLCYSPLSKSLGAPSLQTLLRLRSGEFKRTYRRSALGWRGSAVLRRNAAVALGNALDRSCVGVLMEALTEDSHPMVRGHAAWALGRIASPAALGALRGRRAHEADPTVLEEIDAALEPFESR
ncbi:MAG: tRNA epoxyqueuosine(34) reductase QueG [Candidatus Eremiobacteraeota bacterium]|nr:tRNA epoxyqueuosine(34) reductase QueG [Candidatus Eremiobacteraeota bacterium]